MNQHLQNIAYASPFYQKVKASQINQIDLSRGESHYAQHSCLHSLALFTRIKEETQNALLRVSLHVDSKDRICFATADIYAVYTNTRFLYNLNLVPYIEYLLDTDITNNPKLLPAIRNRSFGQRARHLFNKNCASAMPSEMTISECGKHYFFHTDRQDHFEAGIAHFAYMMDQIGGYHWFDPNTKPRQGEIYASLEAYEPRSIIQLRLFSYDAAGDEVTQYRFRLTYGGQVAAAVGSILAAHPKAEDGLLLNLIRTYAAPFAEEAA